MLFTNKKGLVLLLMEEILHHLGYIKTLVNNGINYQPQLVSFPDFWLPSTVPLESGKLVPIITYQPPNRPPLQASVEQPPYSQVALLIKWSWQPPRSKLCRRDRTVCFFVYPREDSGTLGNIREPPPLRPLPLNNPIN